MNYENIQTAANEVGLKGRDNVIFCLFFSKRFPDESNNITSYVAEWAQRFKDEVHIQKMDTWSLDIHNKVIKLLDEVWLAE